MLRNSHKVYPPLTYFVICNHILLISIHIMEKSELFHGTLMISVADIFPPVSLNFAGGASMFLNPQDYLIQQNSVVSTFNSAISIESFHRNLSFSVVLDLTFVSVFCFLGRYCSVVHRFSEDTESGDNNPWR